MPPTVWFSDGFESNDLFAWTATEENDGNIATSSAWASAGTYSAEVDITEGVEGVYARVKKTGLNIAVGNYIFSSARWYFPSASFNPTANLWLWIIHEGASPWKGFQVVLNSSEQLYVVDTVNTATYTQASPIGVPLDESVGIELEIYAHESAGYIKLRQNGVVIIEETGIDTQPVANYDYIIMGAHYIDGGMDYDLTYYFDEVYVQDSQKIPAPTVDQTAARIKGVIQRELDAIVARIKGNIYYGVDQTPTRIKGVIQHDYDTSALRIKGVIWRLIHETFTSDIRALTADADQTSLRIKGKISLPVTALLNSDIRGQTGILTYPIRIKGAISNDIDLTATRIKGIISGPHTETALRIKGFILGEPQPTVLRIKGTISHDAEDIIRIKGVIKQDYDSAALRIKGVIWNQVSAIRIKGKISRDYDNTPLRIKGTLLPVFDQPVLRIKGSIIYGVEHYTRIKGKIHGIISTIRIKGDIIYGVDEAALRIKGSIGTPSDESPLRIKGVIRSDAAQTALRIKGEIGKKRPMEFEKQDSWFVKDDTERFDKKDWPFETRER